MLKRLEVGFLLRKADFPTVGPKRGGCFSIQTFQSHQESGRDGMLSWDICRGFLKELFIEVYRGGDEAGLLSLGEL